jgi:hypothetical protein
MDSVSYSVRASTGNNSVRIPVDPTLRRVSATEVDGVVREAGLFGRS